MGQSATSENDIVDLDLYRRRRADAQAQRSAAWAVGVAPAAAWWALWVVWYPMWIIR